MDKKGKVPKIKKVKDVPENDKFDGIHDYLPKMPCLMIIIGSVKSGKSNYIINLLCNNDFYKGMFEIVQIISTTLYSDNKGKILDKYFDCNDNFDDSLIEGIKEEQSQYPKEERPTRALILDDCLTHKGGGGLSRNDSISFFSTRFRHYINFYCITTQSFKNLSPLIRNNANAVIICRLQNTAEKNKVMEEYGDLVGGQENFLKMYDEVHSEPYNIMYLDLQSNPARVFKNHEKQLYP